MTENLKSLMTRAADQIGPALAAPDLAAIAASGARRVRRRRAGVLGTGVAAAVLLGSGAWVLADHPHVADISPSGAPGPVAPVNGVTWAWDGALHTGDGRAFDVGHPITAYVRTHAGYAFTDGHGAVFSYVGGVVSRIGTISASHPVLRADEEGPWAGWVDPSGDEPRFVAYNLRTAEVERFGEPGPGMGQLADEADPFYFYGIDGRTAYVRDSRGAIAVDVVSGEVRVVDAQARNGFDVKGVENGKLAFAVEDPAAGEAGTMIGTRPGHGVELRPGWGGVAVFSPDGHWVSLDADEPEVYDATTGKRVTIDVDGRAFATGFEWLDDNTLVMAAGRTTTGTLELLSCDLRARTCDVVAPDLGTFADIEGKIAVANGITSS